MTANKLFATAAILTSMIATPVLAQNTREGSQNPAQIKKQQMKNPNVRQSDRRVYRDRNVDVRYDNRGYDTDTGFFPLDAATGIAGAAVGTAAAIATAPFGGNRWDNGYAYNDGYSRTGYRDSYASVNNDGRVGAFATAPYTNPYEYNRVTDNGWYGQSYNQRNQFVCEPGTIFTNVNGIRTLCQ